MVLLLTSVYIPNLLTYIGNSYLENVFEKEEKPKLNRETTQLMSNLSQDKVPQSRTWNTVLKPY